MRISSPACPPPAPRATAVSEAPAYRADFWLPALPLRGLVSGYHRYVVDPGAGRRHRDLFYPAWGNLRFHRAAEPWRVAIGERHYEVPTAALFGPTSHATDSDSAGGTMIGAGLTPLGWSRLIGASADTVADAVVDAASLLPEAEALGSALLAGADVAESFDRFFLTRVGRPSRDDALIEAIHRALLEEDPASVDALASRLAISTRTLHRVARAAFGFAPKLLLRRTRFLRSLTALAAAPDAAGAAVIDASYHDLPHFIRDSHLFLGMTPGEFLRLRKPLNDASSRKREEVLGAPAQALHAPATVAGRSHNAAIRSA